MTPPQSLQTPQDAQEQARHRSCLEMNTSQRTGLAVLRYAPGAILGDAAGKVRYRVQENGEWRKI